MSIYVYRADKQTITRFSSSNVSFFFFFVSFVSRANSISGWKQGITRNDDLEWIARMRRACLTINYSPALATDSRRRQAAVNFHFSFTYSRIRQSGSSRPRPIPDCPMIHNSCKINGSSSDQRNWIEATLKPTSSDYSAFVTRAGLKLREGEKEDSIIVIRKLCWQKADITGEIPAI